LGEERPDIFSDQEFRPEGWEIMKRKILKRDIVPAVLLYDRTLPDTLLKKMPFRRLNWAAATAVIVIVTLVTYFLIRHRTNVQHREAAITRTNIPPGGNRATLTLGNGATMVLDSEAIGALAQQGNTKISITDSGGLAYTFDNSGTNHEAAIEENILTTPPGGKYQLELPDGTKLWLNAASSITYPTAFTGNQRFVKLTGEIYFEVVHNPNMPFVVKAGNQVITDLGTSFFNINANKEGGAITTTVLQGSVKIFVGTKTNLLFPGQQEITSFEGESVTIKNIADIDKVMAWRRNAYK
jgi:transmembrane sensor